MATHSSISCLEYSMDRGAWWATVHGDSPGKSTGVGCHALTPGDLPHPGIEPVFLMSPALAGGFFTTRAINSLKCYLL